MKNLMDSIALLTAHEDRVCIMSGTWTALMCLFLRRTVIIGQLQVIK